MKGEKIGYFIKQNKDLTDCRLRRLRARAIVRRRLLLGVVPLTAQRNRPRPGQLTPRFYSKFNIRPFPCMVQTRAARVPSLLLPVRPGVCMGWRLLPKRAPHTTVGSTKCYSQFLNLPSCSYCRPIHVHQGIRSGVAEWLRDPCTLAPSCQS